jgi:hypothetical protein
MLDPEALTIGYARRFTAYKRPELIFHDPDRLARILNAIDRPMQIVFAGKAHPRDKDGQDFARTVFEMTRAEGMRGKVVLLDEYDMRVGRALVSGCDVWLNNPIRPYEASGTSGMKPPMHGGIKIAANLRRRTRQRGDGPCAIECLSDVCEVCAADPCWGSPRCRYWRSAAVKARTPRPHRANLA